MWDLTGMDLTRREWGGLNDEARVTADRIRLTMKTSLALGTALAAVAGLVSMSTGKIGSIVLSNGEKVDVPTINFSHPNTSLVAQDNWTFETISPDRNFKITYYPPEYRGMNVGLVEIVPLTEIASNPQMTEEIFRRSVAVATDWSDRPNVFVVPWTQQPYEVRVLYKWKEIPTNWLRVADGPQE